MRIFGIGAWHPDFAIAAVTGRFKKLVDLLYSADRRKTGRVRLDHVCDYYEMSRHPYFSLVFGKRTVDGATQY
jgi:hypothetical protein